MIFYHGTTTENWDVIQKEGMLFGRRFVVDNKGNIIKDVGRCTYLAVDYKEACCYGDIVLEVEYDPFKHERYNNYCKGCWQVRIYEPILLKDVKNLVHIIMMLLIICFNYLLKKL